MVASVVLERWVIGPDQWRLLCGQDWRCPPHRNQGDRARFIGWWPTLPQVRVRRYRCVDCCAVWRQDTLRAAAGRGSCPGRDLLGAQERGHRPDVNHQGRIAGSSQMRVSSLVAARARQCRDRRRGLPMMEVLTLAIWKTSTRITLPSGYPISISSAAWTGSGSPPSQRIETDHAVLDCRVMEPD